MNSKEVIVSITLGGENLRVGKLWFHVRNGRESATFKYDKKWLEHPEKFALEPALKLTEGTFHTPIEIRPRILTTAINFDDTSASLDTAMEVAKDFRLSKTTAREIIKEVGATVKQWRQVALNFGLSKLECDRMASAFQIA